MSPQEEKTSETGKDTGKDTGSKSLLFGLWKKVSGGKKAAKKSQDSEGGATPDIPEGAAPAEEAPPPPPSFADLGAPEELIEYFQQYCHEQQRSDHRFSVRDFCEDPLPEEALLKQTFSQLDSKAATAMKEFRRQAKIAALKEEQRQRSQARAQAKIKADTDEEEEPEPDPQPEEEETLIPTVNGQALVFAANDWSAAWGMALPPLGDGEGLTYRSVRDILDEKYIGYGVDADAINRMIAPEGALQLIRLAVCDPAVPGEDGRTEEHFPRTVGTPQLKEDANGNVEFDNLNWLTHIDAGTVICDIIEPTQGKPGTDIQGKTIRPYNGKKAPLPKGDGVIPNEDGTALVAKIDGQISFRDGKFHVNNLIEVKGNVDLSTGSLNVNGDLVVRGNVLAGFTVQASGNITIGGLVEGSKVIAGGSIVISRGMNGNVTGSLDAGKDIVCKYVENATIRAEGDVRMDSIVNCDVAAKGRVVTKTGRGTIIGGTIRSMEGIEAKTIGNIAGRLTTMIIGLTPKFREEQARLEDELSKLYEMEHKLGSAIVQMKEKPLKAALEEMDRVEEAVSRKQIVASKLLPMAQVTIGGLVKNITDTFSPCRIYLDAKEGMIKVINV